MKVACENSLYMKGSERHTLLSDLCKGPSCPKSRIEDEFTHILQSQKPSLVVVPAEFFSYCETPALSVPPCPPMCTCGGNNNCCSCCSNRIAPKKFHCTVEGCNYSTIRKSDMKIHVRSHTGDKPYKCPYADCNYAAVTRSILVIHIRTHTGEKPLKCPYRTVTRRLCS